MDTVSTCLLLVCFLDWVSSPEDRYLILFSAKSLGWDLVGESLFICFLIKYPWGLRW